MTVRASQPSRSNRFWVFFVVEWLDVLAIAAWGILLLKYWFTGELKLLIHPHYFWLVLLTAICLLILSALKAWNLVISRLRTPSRREKAPPPSVGHITLFPPGWSSGLLLATAILGLLVAPKIFTSQTAVQRGVNESLTITRSKTQSFRTSTRSEERSLIDWVRTLNVYPEPDAYIGKKAKVQGFVVYPPELPEQYLLITRFVITCCAADAYPVALPVKLTGSRKDYPTDTWLEVEGKMIAETQQDKRQLIIEASSVKKIPPVSDPYAY